MRGAPIAPVSPLRSSNVFPKSRPSTRENHATAHRACTTEELTSTRLVNKTG